MSALKNLANSLARREILVPYLKEHLLKEADMKRKGLLKEKDIVVKDAKMTIRTFRRRMDEYNHREEPESPMAHPSSLGRCMREMFFGAKNAPYSVDGETGEVLLRQTLTFEIGTYVHVMFQNLCRRAGALVRREVPIKSAKHRIIGHADGILNLEGQRHLLEIKTINTRGFTLLTEPKADHKIQVTAYMKMLELKNTIIIYYDKDRGQLKEYSFPYVPEFYLKNVKGRIDYLFASLEENFIPQREGNDPHRFPCMFCSFARLCWDDRALAKWASAEGYSMKAPPLLKYEEKATRFSKAA